MSKSKSKLWFQPTSVKFASISYILKINLLVISHIPILPAVCLFCVLPGWPLRSCLSRQPWLKCNYSLFFQDVSIRSQIITHEKALQIKGQQSHLLAQRQLELKTPPEKVRTRLASHRNKIKTANMMIKESETLTLGFPRIKAKGLW